MDIRRKPIPIEHGQGSPLKPVLPDRRFLGGDPCPCHPPRRGRVSTVALIACAFWCILPAARARGQSPLSMTVLPVQSGGGVVGALLGQFDSNGDDFFAEEPDDRLSPKDRRLTRGLTDRGMPELVEALLADHPPEHRVYIARAYARGAVDVRDPSLRERFFKKAAQEYRDAIALEEDPDWLRGLRRGFNITEWRVELADLILRHWIAADLDRYEVTSGLDYNRRRLTKLLREADETYRDAAQSLDTFFVSLRTQEERFLLLGIADRITTLVEHRDLNSAWASVYLAMVGDVEASDRAYMLEYALSMFDAVSRSADEPPRKYNALLGAGIALRESGRHTEAQAAFDRVRNSTASVALTARARYERARTLTSAGRFGAARMELDGLAVVSTTNLAEEDAGAVFYVRLAPLIHAYTYAQEAQRTRGGPTQKARLQEKAMAEFAEISKRGGVWAELVRIYLDALAGTKRGLAELTPTELRVTAARLMNEKNYAEAIKALRLLRTGAGGEAFRAETLFNLGVCCFQTRDLRGASEAFRAAARHGDDADLTERAAEYAYRCLRQVARDSKSTDDYMRLAETSEFLVDRFPDHELADQAVWVAALARQEAGDYETAMTVYAKVPPASEHYWDARRNLARCKRASYYALPIAASSERRSRSARRAASAWVKLADDLAHGRTGATSGPDTAADDTPARRRCSPGHRWIDEARLNAAAILAGNDARQFEECLEILAGMKPTASVLSLRIRSYRGLGDLKQAKRVLDDYLGEIEGPEVGAVLIELAAEMETEIVRLRDAGRREDAVRMAQNSLPTFRQLLEWIEGQPAHRKHVPVVRFSLAKVLALAGRRDRSMALLEKLMANDSTNGSYVRAAALLQEDITLEAVARQREVAADLAESLWAKLLKDATLRERAPAEYWEARYHWLKHQLRHARASEVLNGIEAEQAWYPDLGGPPWQARLLELARRARMMVGSEGDSP